MRRVSATGTVKKNVAPRSGLFSAHSWPPWLAMMVRLIDNPIPSPPCLVVWKGSKIRSARRGNSGAAIAHGHSHHIFAGGDRPHTRFALVRGTTAHRIDAFTSRFSTTCCSSIQSPITRGRPGAASNNIRH